MYYEELNRIRIYEDSVGENFIKDGDITKDYVEPYPVTIMQRLWDWYNYRDYFIRSVRNHLWKYIFDGEITVKIPEENVLGRRSKTGSDLEWKQFLSDSLDWLIIFGMVPWIYMKNEVTGKLYPVVPKFGTGKFVLYRKKDTVHYQVGWQSFIGVKNRNSSSNSDLIKIMEDSGYKVSSTSKTRLKSIFPIFQSDLSTLLQSFDDLTEMKKNLLTGDYGATHPTTIIENSDKPISVSELTMDQLLYPDQNTVLDTIREKIDENRKAQLDMINRTTIQKSDYIANVYGRGGTVRSLEKRKHIDLQKVPTGCVVSKAGVEFRVLTNFLEQKREYETQVASILMARKNLITGEAIINNNKLQSKYNQTDLMSTLSHYRQALTELVNDVYIRTFWDYDKKILEASVKLEDEEIEKNRPNFNKKAKLEDESKKSDEEEKEKEKKEIVPKITKKGFEKRDFEPPRIEIEFEESVEDSSLEIVDLVALINIQALSVAEARAVLKTQFGFDTINPNEHIDNRQDDEKNVQNGKIVSKPSGVNVVKEKPKETPKEKPKEPERKAHVETHKPYHKEKSLINSN